ncbi:hypothetical protein EV182_001563 [Spiromyces aspiralis]|uniref:Uncharacterized protein n=1 Tax=Spiromyces aspiralis TaxID=68401 RepID=A0ACC1HWG7_9FUNG|nr:hypothetical protein EV182_001563 [Spiromyces aspiralis]
MTSPDVDNKPLLPPNEPHREQRKGYAAITSNPSGGGQVSDVHGSAGSLNSGSTFGSPTEETPGSETKRLTRKLKGAIIDDRDIENMRKRGSKRLANFYEEQNDLIKKMLRVHDLPNVDDLERQDDAEGWDMRRKALMAINLSVGFNAVLVLVQLYAALSSGSLSLFATMADAMMDLLSSLILMFANIAAEQKDTHKRYPSGRSRIETVGIIVFASLMGAFSSGLLVESARSLLSSEPRHNSLNLVNGLCIVLALVCKLGLFLFCYSLRSNHSAHILMVDHRNDLFVNAFGLAMAIMGHHIYSWIDPLGCLVIALVILRSWIREAWEQMEFIVGISADPHFLQLLTYIAMTHHWLITHVDTVRAYHSGARLFVEVDIVMSPDTPLRILHDVAETLQNRYESMDHVERAFVHVDYECLHPPEHSSSSK